MMNFRQRMGWLGVTLYLLLSMALVYYVFEVQRFSLEHVHSAAAGPSPPAPALGWSQSLHAQLPSFPAWLWALLFLLLYLQVFLFVFSCTRADPHAIGYCVLPVCLALLCSRQHGNSKSPNQLKQLQLIDT
ncbi:transmembrane protein 251 [Thalassophryne amazonica]|uniref:transmembrane protein 251 n=1 Tax=Thalassophryne amazonica TaxID=390379 RepID=UPI0014720ACC|nr:transmembrane protein 251 [Thalassophryne amazonica]XP_034018056.1 transmembrane protein 251 [Thalassophryne amazonica]